MLFTFRRIVMAVAAAGTATAGTIALAPAAQAASVAETCLNQLAGRAAATSPTLIYPAQKAEINLSTSEHTSRECRGITVSLGLSRTDLTGFQNKGASWSWGTGRAYYSARFLLAPNQPGTWMTRQIYVRDHAGKTAVRTFTAATTPTKVTVYRESYLEARSTLKPIHDGKLRVAGRLQAHSSVGTRANLANQTVLVQVRRVNESAYTTIAKHNTGQYGNFYDASVSSALHRGKLLRVVFISKIQTIASDYTYVGVVQ